MTAADAREELEAVIHAQLTRAWKYGLRAPSDPKARGALTPAQAILAAHDRAVAAAADAEVNRVISDPVLRIKRQRLLAAAAEAFPGRQM